jgi:hypothetical protein
MRRDSDGKPSVKATSCIGRYHEVTRCCIGQAEWTLRRIKKKRGTMVPIIPRICIYDDVTVYDCFGSSRCQLIDIEL